MLHSLPEFNFFRLLPKNAAHRDAKGYVKVIPVKLSQRHYGYCTQARKKAGFSDENVLFLSADGKARVPLGLPVSK